MYSPSSKDLLMMNILDTLKKYSNSDQRFSQKDIHRRTTVFDFIEKAKGIVAALEEENPLHGILTRTLLEDHIPPDDGLAMYVFNFSNKIIRCLVSAMELHFNLCKILDKLCCRVEVDFENEFDYFAVGTVR